ncbi:hypothetical protein PB2503_00460 [Parvularcula bermudensis HTCC2503]|uniref:Phosphatidic acid phosphatase type 2/haloperoxidase domain-containing protein n=1 Tax=Parvularcula bermudensis (strain ATCC BAA-594 / HTCC2503 / KCTC 12087) TaxID=314260 RepID=E0TIK1_PARBH|nr:phosphatase PAP2 family protein [Parvularcula bermudensis]ADM10859.1 hypothetical protein PB2503_00460 [Parvularcula bermudensis HTCC2503]
MLRDKLKITSWAGPIPIGIAFGSAGLLIFLWLMEEVAEQEYQHLDQALLVALRDPVDPDRPLGPDWLVTSMTDLTALGGYTVLTLIVLFACACLFVLRQRLSVAILLGSVLSGIVASTLIKMLFDRARPDVVPHLVTALSPSFPSGHAMLSATTYLTVGAIVAQAARQKRLRFIIIFFSVLVTLLVGCSRVYLGVHYPTDVFAGWAAGTAWASFWWIADRSLRGRTDA